MTPFVLATIALLVLSGRRGSALLAGGLHGERPRGAPGTARRRARRVWMPQLDRRRAPYARVIIAVPAAIVLFLLPRS
jgi:hypothetical protein